MPGVFQFRTFLSVVFIFRPSSNLWNSFFYVVYPFDFSVMIYSFRYFAPKLFCFLTSGCCYAFTHSPQSSWPNFVLVWEYFVFLHCLILCWYIFSLPSFASTFLLILSSCIVCSVLLWSFCPNIFSHFSCFSVFPFLKICISVSHYYYCYSLRVFTQVYLVFFFFSGVSLIATFLWCPGHFSVCYFLLICYFFQVIWNFFYGSDNNQYHFHFHIS